MHWRIHSYHTQNKPLSLVWQKSPQKIKHYLMSSPAVFCWISRCNYWTTPWIQRRDFLYYCTTALQTGSGREIVCSSYVLKEDKLISKMRESVKMVYNILVAPSSAIGGAFCSALQWNEHNFNCVDEGRFPSSDSQPHHSIYLSFTRQEQ